MVLTKMKKPEAVELANRFVSLTDSDKRRLVFLYFIIEKEAYKNQIRAKSAVRIVFEHQSSLFNIWFNEAIEHFKDKPELT